MSKKKAPKIEIAKDPDLGYYAIRVNDFTIGTFNFANFYEQISERASKKEKEVEAWFFDGTVKAKIIISRNE